MTGSPGAAGPPMSAEGVDHALRGRREERDRISDGVLDLDAHTILRLLKTSALRGETSRRWERAQGRLALLWALLDAYRGVLEEAERIRGGHRRLGPEELTGLTWLLTGPAVRLAPDSGPVERRRLLGPGEQRFTLDEAVAAMELAFHDVTGLVAEVDAVWNAVLPRLDAAAAEAGAARDLLRELGGDDPDLGACEREIERVREELRHDPLGDGGRDVEWIADAAARLHERVRRAAGVRCAYGPRREALRALLGRVAAAEQEFLRTRDLVVTKIASPALPALPGRAAPLGERLAALDAPAPAEDGAPGPAGPGGPGGDGGERWLERADLLAELERAAEEALRRAEGAVASLRELIERRDELRGRLEAFRARAVRLGLAEDPALARAHLRAHDLLWTAPCDLRKATEAVTGYQRAIQGAAG
ncbi:hypothetical protein [Planobispora rosea]|uniref:hypothetical protein n=1 Tax=Planobispora rosea TaxID=35762 RepID=UPI00114CF720|nr:hypothetical protein [Planobispora rosea]